MLEQKYNSTGNAVASYDYYEIQEGTGIQIFYGWNSISSAGEAYNLGTQTFYSNKIQNWTENATTSITVDNDYDLSPFNMPRSIQGTGVVTFTGKIQADIETASGAFTVKIRKVSGGVETEITSKTTQGVGDAAGCSSEYALFNLIMDIPDTSFKRGDILRLTMQANATKTAGSNSFHVVYGQDPKNRDGTHIIPSTDSPASTTQLIFACPFKVDV
jgi:hypothetical protein